MKKKNRFLRVFIFVGLYVAVSVGGGGALLKIIPAVFAAEAMVVPTIAVSPDVYYPLDEILYLEGRAEPNAVLQIQFQKQGARPVQFGARSDPNGEWVLAEKVSLEAGDWEVRVREVVSTEKVSEWSNPRVFKVVVSGVTIGGVNVKFASLVLAIVILLIGGIAIIFYFVWKVKRLHSVLLAKEIREAEGSVRKGFSELRRDLLEELRILESSPGKILSMEEISRKEHILRELELLQKNMEREISDIDSKIGNG